MDTQSTRTLLNITEFKGMNTNSPRGLVTAPILLENVYLEHTGGYSAMRESKVIEAGGAGAQWWGVMSEMTYNHPDMVRLMPGLLLSRDGQTWALQGGETASVLKYSLGHLLEKDKDYRLWRLDRTPLNDGWEWVVDLGTPLNAGYDWIVLFADGSTAQFSRHVKLSEDGNSEPYVLLLTRPAGEEGPAQVWRKSLEKNSGPTGSEAGYQFYGSVRPTDAYTIDGQPVLLLAANPPTGGDYVAAPTQLAPRLAEFHKNRVYAAGVLSYLTVGAEGLQQKQENQTNRVYYSGIIAQATDEAKPSFAPDKYFDVPFSISRSVTALVGVGPHLYIFGERELWIMSGDPDYNAQLDQIGDSIGTVAPGSVQQLSGTVYWLSDSSALAARSGQIADIGEPVRDLLLSLRTELVTSTTDFKRELWWLTDGELTLCYHVREGGWTLRSEPGLQLLQAGGQPYAMKGLTLVTLNGDTKLPTTVTFPYTELGEWRLRKVVQGLAVGLDLAEQPAAVTNLSRVDDQHATTQVIAQPKGAGQVKLHTTQDGTNMQGLAVQVSLRVDTQDRRGILRPPLSVFGSAGGEEPWDDRQQ